MNDDRAKPTLDVWTLLGIGTYNVVCLLLGMGLGWFIDSWIDTFPVFVLIGLACGIALGVVGTWRQMKPFLRD